MRTFLHHTNCCVQTPKKQRNFQSTNFNVNRDLKRLQIVTIKHLHILRRNTTALHKATVVILIIWVCFAGYKTSSTHCKNFLVSLLGLVQPFLANKSDNWKWLKCQEILLFLLGMFFNSSRQLFAPNKQSCIFVHRAQKKTHGKSRVNWLDWRHVI